MFFGCLSLKEIVLSNFIFENTINMTGMLSWCSDELEMKMRAQIKNLKEEAFEYNIFFKYTKD